MTGFLASVRNVQQARIALSAGADLIDLKDPERGSLGALSCAEVGETVRALGGARMVSATVGDLPMEPLRVTRAVRQMADTGVDYVKVGISARGDTLATVRALAGMTRPGLHLIAVLFADEGAMPVPIEILAGAGFHGCMLDTQDKSRGPLTSVLSIEALHRFVRAVREHALLCGLAGSLRPEDIPALVALQPDYLGFRGALCRRGQRTEDLDRDRVLAIAQLVRTQQLSVCHPADGDGYPPTRRMDSSQVEGFA